MKVSTHADKDQEKEHLEKSQMLYVNLIAVCARLSYRRPR